MKKLMLLGMMFLLLSSMVFAQPITQYRVGANEDFVEATQTQEMTMSQVQERVQLIEQVRNQYFLECENCTYEIDESDNQTIITEERPGKFLGISVTMRERYALNEEGNIEQKNQNFFAFLERFGLAREV